MDHSRLNILILGVLALSLSACVTHKAPTTEAQSPIKKSFAEVALSPADTFREAEKYLEWQKGYSLRVRDAANGLLVTDWTLDSPTERHQITLRVTPDTVGSLLSAHILKAYLQNSQWIDSLSDGSLEDFILQDFQSQLPTARR